MQEIPLSGGNSTEVVQVGATVRRARGPWSATIEQLLVYLEQRSFAGAPRFLGIDAHGREILSFLPGDVGEFPYTLAEPALIQAARLLRQLHDATASFPIPPDAAWQLPIPEIGQEFVICHNDFAPYNLVFVDQLPIAMIDFDTAGPGPRAWDVAYALFRFVPLVHTDLPDTPGLHDLLGAAARVKLFCDSYGIRASPDLLNLVERRLHALCLYLITRALRGDLAYQRMLTDGHLEIYQRAILALQQAQPALEHCLST